MFASAQPTGGNVFVLELCSILLKFEISFNTLSFDICHHLPNIDQLLMPYMLMQYYYKVHKKMCT
ncbi:hypothetical protein Hanom_Chr13g01224161 [Helianthus anomalus]